eukprot:5697136-Ditylum_brightwellii.AAC.1
MDQPCRIASLPIKALAELEHLVPWKASHHERSLHKGIAKASGVVLELEHDGDEQNEAKCCPVDHWRVGVNVIDCLLLENSSNSESGLERLKGITGESFDFHGPGGGNNLNTLRQLELGNQGP